MTAPATLLRILQGSLLASSGAFMAWLSRSPFYWQLLNPRYSWLTLGAGLILTLLGIIHLLHAGQKGRPTETLALTLFLALAALAILGPDAFAPPPPTYGSGYSGGSLTRTFDDETPQQPTVTVGDITYTRLNLAELLAGETGGWANENGHFAIQGAVLRTPELDRAGYIAVARLYVYCCFADAVGVVTLVAVNHPENHRPGSWVRVLGTLTPDAPFQDRSFEVTGALSTARSQHFVLDANKIEETPVEGVPFILEIRQKAPFAY
ncbi:hypothetical protein [Pseudodesulfovibrio sp.]|uniref:TIGR03943 family putative permease subunit n=1 Tax=Pseudodesulfovibrio sp. TaxID=2035812 RepID=UPI0026060DAC|nr:hypothetical protein [Pseudodesulfovibrio sp.]MDD3310592.1 hypothetical protein [Pseudodesulfovibrio sp.]